MREPSIISATSSARNRSPWNELAEIVVRAKRAEGLRWVPTFRLPNAFQHGPSDSIQHEIANGGPGMRAWEVLPEDRAAERLLVGTEIRERKSSKGVAS